MNKYILGIIAGVVFVGTVVTAVLYHDLYKQQQKKTEVALAQIEKLNELVEANKQNNDSNLSDGATEFIKLLFHSEGNKSTRDVKGLLSLTTGNAYRELTESQSKTHWGHKDHLEGFKSEAHVKDSVYNRVSETEGKVIVEFEHWLTKDGSTAKTVNRAEIQMKYVKGKWKVSGYEIEQLL